MRAGWRSGSGRPGRALFVSTPAGAGAARGESGAHFVLCFRSAAGERALVAAGGPGGAKAVIAAALWRGSAGPDSLLGRTWGRCRAAARGGKTPGTGRSDRKAAQFRLRVGPAERR